MGCCCGYEKRTWSRFDHQDNVSPESANFNPKTLSAFTPPPPSVNSVDRFKYYPKCCNNTRYIIDMASNPRLQASNNAASHSQVFNYIKGHVDNNMPTFRPELFFPWLMSNNSDPQVIEQFFEKFLWRPANPHNVQHQAVSHLPLPDNVAEKSPMPVRAETIQQFFSNSCRASTSAVQAVIRFGNRDVTVMYGRGTGAYTQIKLPKGKGKNKHNQDPPAKPLPPVDGSSNLISNVARCVEVILSEIDRLLLEPARSGGAVDAATADKAFKAILLDSKLDVANAPSDPFEKRDILFKQSHYAVTAQPEGANLLNLAVKYHPEDASLFSVLLNYGNGAIDVSHRCIFLPDADAHPHQGTILPPLPPSVLHQLCESDLSVFSLRLLIQSGRLLPEMRQSDYLANDTQNPQIQLNCLMIAVKNLAVEVVKELIMNGISNDLNARFVTGGPPGQSHPKNAHELATEMQQYYVVNEDEVRQSKCQAILNLLSNPTQGVHVGSVVL